MINWWNWVYLSWTIQPGHLLGSGRDSPKDRRKLKTVASNEHLGWRVCGYHQCHLPNGSTHPRANHKHYHEHHLDDWHDPFDHNPSNTPIGACSILKYEHKKSLGDGMPHRALVSLWTIHILYHQTGGMLVDLRVVLLLESDYTPMEWKKELWGTPTPPLITHSNIQGYELQIFPVWRPQNISMQLSVAYYAGLDMIAGSVSEPHRCQGHDPLVCTID